MSFFVTLLKARRGFGLIIAVVTILIFSVTSVVVVSLVSSDSDIALHQFRSTDSSYIARAGMERALYEFKNGTATCVNLDYGPITLGTGTYTTAGDLFNLSNSLNGGIDADDTTITVDDITGFAPHGRITIGTEDIDYTDISGNSFTGAKRGANGTPVAPHLDDAPVSQNYCRVRSTGTVTGPLGNAQKVMESGMVGATATGIKSVQNGAWPFPTFDNIETVNISQVDRTKSFLVFGYNFDYASPSSTLLTGQITSDTQLTFQRVRDDTNVPINIEWYVAEFNSGVTVQRGTVAALNLATHNVTLPTSVDPNKSVPIISYRHDGTTYAAGDFVNATLTSCSPNCTTLELRRNSSSTTTSVVEWQVITFTNATVYTGTGSFNTTGTSTNITFCSSGCPADRTNEWLIFSYRTNAGTASNIGQKMIRAQLASSAAAGFQRDSSGQSMAWTFYVVAFNDGTTVRWNNGYSTFTSAQTSKTIPSSEMDPVGGYPIDRTRSIATAGGWYMHGGKTPYTADDNTGVGSVTLDMPTDSNLTLARGATGSTTADIFWQVVTFAAGSGVGSVNLIDFREVYN